MVATSTAKSINIIATSTYGKDLVATSIRFALTLKCRYKLRILCFKVALHLNRFLRNCDIFLHLKLHVLLMQLCVIYVITHTLVFFGFIHVFS